VADYIYTPVGASAIASAEASAVGRTRACTQMELTPITANSLVRHTRSALLKQLGSRNEQKEPILPEHVCSIFAKHAAAPDVELAPLLNVMRLATMVEGALRWDDLSSVSLGSISGIFPGPGVSGSADLTSDRVVDESVGTVPASSTYVTAEPLCQGSCYRSRRRHSLPMRGVHGLPHTASGLGGTICAVPQAGFLGTDAFRRVLQGVGETRSARELARHLSEKWKRSTVAETVQPGPDLGGAECEGV
jgi:hypothetical protein